MPLDPELTEECCCANRKRLDVHNRLLWSMFHGPVAGMCMTCRATNTSCMLPCTGAARQRNGGIGGKRAWQLRTVISRQWRAFPEKLRAVAVSEDELVAVTAGRGAAGGEVVRAWSIADGGPGILPRPFAVH